MLKKVAEDLDFLEIWARIKCGDVDTNEGRNFIVCDGCVHFLNITRTVESLEWWLLSLRR